MSSKEEFLQIANNNIKREGISQLLTFLEKSDFFTSPASTKFHSNYEGGLCDHSIKVYKRFVRLLKDEYGENYQNVITDESASIIALFHDICKVDTYKTDYKNVKVNGVWTQQPYFVADDELPYGHGEKSVYMLSGFMKLTREEAMAINWHMGGFDLRVQAGSYDYSKAYNKYPLALMIHLADMQATFLDEATEN